MGDVNYYTSTYAAPAQPADLDPDEFGLTSVSWAALIVGLAWSWVVLAWGWVMSARDRVASLV